jgi:hypothetical protein
MNDEVIGMRPLAIDLFCGLGGWTEGLLAEGYYVVGFDIERHEYGDAKYPAQLVIQDVLTLHGRQFKDAALIVASPPCQAYSYRAMPWSRAKALPPPDNSLFEACFRIQREACEAAGRHIPLIVENVRGAQKWVGRSRWNYGSFHLWGDVPALMPMTAKRGQKFNPDGTAHPSGSWFAVADSKNRGARSTKNSGVSWFNIANNTTSGHNRNPVHQLSREGVKQAGISGMRANGKGDRWFQDGAARSGSKSKARKAASAAIAKIPFPLAVYIASIFRPREAA